MSSLVSIAGIDQAIANLSLNPDTQKAKLLAAIRSCFSNPEDLQTVTEIAPDALVVALWDDDPTTLKARRKSLSSLKSSLNKSLKDLTAQGLNPEGLIIGRSNVFEVSEEQKKSLLEQLGYGGADARLAETIASLKKAFPEIIGDTGGERLSGLFHELEQARGIIDKLQDALREKDSEISTLQKKISDFSPTSSVGASEQDLGFEQKELEGEAPPLDAEIQELAEGDFEEVEIDDTDLLTEAAGTGDLTDGALTEGEPVLDAEIEELDEGDFEEVEIDDTDLLTEAAGTGDLTDGALTEGEPVLEDEIEEVDEGDFEEVEVTEGASPTQSKLLEVLSKYLEPEDALQGSAATLIESEEGLVSQLLERFTPKFIKIPTDNYPFGCREPSAQEHPLQIVKVTQFYLGQYPVTNDLFELFVRETGYETDAEKNDYGLVYEGRWRSSKDPNTGLNSFAISQATNARRVNGANWRHPSGPGCLLEHRHNHPVVQVSHRDAQAFAAWAGKRLPTEMEWEAAARGQDERLFPWGGAWDSGRGNFSSSCLGDTTPVERYFAKGRSAFGIGDLLGNVYEWTASTQQSQASRHIILKGGCWHSRGIISACHRKLDLESWSNIVGFRLAVSG